jgi:hypothetical protein
MKVIIEQFIGEYAIVELPNQIMIDVPRILFEGAVEGDVIDISIDISATKVRKNNVEQLMKSLFLD